MTTILDQQVGDVGPILDMMAVVLENIPTSAIVARTTISAVYRIAQIAASIPNLSYHKKVSSFFSFRTLNYFMKISH